MRITTGRIELCRKAGRKAARNLMAALLITGSVACVSFGQDPATVTPQVQTLYSEATAAEKNGDHAMAIQKYQDIIKLSPGLARAYNNLGRLYFNQGNYPAAIKVLEKGLAIDPEMYPAYVILGASYSQSGEYKKAKAPLEAALAKNPSDLHAEMMLASTLMNLNDYEAGAAHLRHILTQNPDDRQAQYLLGKAYLQLSKETLAKVIQHDPDSVLAHEIKGEEYENINDFDGALVEYKKAVDLDPHQPGTHFHLANAFWIIGKWPQAQKEFSAELENDPTSCAARWKMADSMLEAKEPADPALVELNQALKQCPELVQAHLDRARALVKLGNFGEALPDLKIAEAANPDDPSIHFLLSTVYRNQGNASEAKAEIQRYGQLQQKATEKSTQHANDVMAIRSNAQ
jgi:tetratricopeptide (TPR) repeat protein